MPFDFAQFFSTIAGRPGPGGSSRLVDLFEDVKRWLGELSRSAVERWGFYLAEGHPCEVGRCTKVALGECDGCGRPTCLGHARLSDRADILCEECCAKAGGRRRAPRPKPAERAPRAAHDPERVEALEVLGLPPTATWEEVQKRFRKLTAELHPDHQRDARKRRQAEEKFKKVTVAYETLKRRAAA